MNVAIDRSIDIRQLRYFLVVAEELNFRRAAERLHLTQPPLSRQIAALEAALGVRLLERNGQSTRLTVAGQLAKPAFAQAVAAFEAALRQVGTAASPSRERFRMGLPWWVDMSEFGRFEEALRAATGIAADRTGRRQQPRVAGTAAPPRARRGADHDAAGSQGPGP